jgi:hypothetical protein
MPDLSHEARHRARHQAGYRAGHQETSKPGHVIAGLALPTAAAVVLMVCAAGAAVATSAKTGNFLQSASAMGSAQPTTAQLAAKRAPARGDRTGPGACGTFLAIEFLSGERAAQGRFWGWLGVLPKSTPRGVGVELEDVVEAFLGGVVVGEDALGAGPAFVPGGVEEDGLLDAGQVGQEFADAEVQAAVVGLSADEVGDGQGQDVRRRRGPGSWTRSSGAWGRTRRRGGL